MRSVTMNRFLLLLVIVAVIVMALVWLTGPGMLGQAALPPPGPGEAAWRIGIGDGAEFRPAWLALSPLA